MIRVLLIRHGDHDWLGRELVGRKPGIPMNAAGEKQIVQLAGRLASTPVAALYASPLERTRRTAEILAAGWNLPVQNDEAFLEVDFGKWTGKPFSTLDADPAWQRWNKQRASAPSPGGETMLQVQERALRGVGKLQSKHPDSTIAVVSHCDTIRAILAACLHLSLDDLQTIAVDPASVSIVEAQDGRLEAVLLNGTGEDLPPDAAPELWQESG